MEEDVTKGNEDILTIFKGTAELGLETGRGTRRVTVTALARDVSGWEITWKVLLRALRSHVTVLQSVEG